MVAGQPIQTGAQTKEFDEGYERVFGSERRARPGRIVYTRGGEPLPEPIAVGEEWDGGEGRALTTTEELVYGNAKATDGTPINTRKRHREYLKQNGLAMAADYSKEYQEKEAARRERHEDRERRETVERNVYKIFGD
jgi:hypothetical protein